MHSNNSQSISSKFEVRDIHTPIIAAGDLTDGGSGLWFHRNKSYIITKEKADEIAYWLDANHSTKDVIEVEKRRGVFEIHVEPGSINALSSPRPHGDAEGPMLDAVPEGAQIS